MCCPGAYGAKGAGAQHGQFWCRCDCSVPFCVMSVCAWERGNERERERDKEKDTKWVKSSEWVGVRERVKKERDLEREQKWVKERERERETERLSDKEKNRERELARETERVEREKERVREREDEREIFVISKIDPWAIFSGLPCLRISLAFCILQKWCNWVKVIHFARNVTNMWSLTLHS